MNISDIITLYDYSAWADRRVLEASARVSPEQFVRPAGPGLGSLRGTLAHTLDSALAWRMLLQHQTLAYFRTLTDEMFPTPALLAQRWEEERLAMRAYLDGLADADLGGVVRYTTPEGDRRERVLWHCLVHSVNHSTQHRSEAAVILTGYGCSPGGLDFTAFLNELAG